jgi:hypothetical protein
VSDRANDMPSDFLELFGNVNAMDGIDLFSNLVDLSRQSEVESSEGESYNPAGVKSKPLEIANFNENKYSENVF